VSAQLGEKMRRKDMEDNPESQDIHVLYEQDCEFYRYQDSLRWSRYQTAALVEGALLYGLYNLPHATLWELRLLMIAGFLLVLIVSLLSLKDTKDANSHLNRIKSYEKELGDAYQFKNFIAKDFDNLPQGKYLMLAAVTLINLFNLALIFMKW
jgi:hypothetical protein